MTRFKLSTLALALLGSLALTACDNSVDTAATDTYPAADSTAATQPVDDTAPEGITDPTTDPYATDDATTTMGDASIPTEDPMVDQDPSLAPQTDPMDPEAGELDSTDPTDEPTPQP